MVRSFISADCSPRSYTVTLKIGEDEEYTQPLTVLKGPHSEGTVEDIRLQTAMLDELMTDINSLADAINRIEWVRRQLIDVQAIAKDLGETAEAVVSNADDLNPFLGQGQQ